MKFSVSKTVPWLGLFLCLGLIVVKITAIKGLVICNCAGDKLVANSIFYFSPVLIGTLFFVLQIAATNYDGIRRFADISIGLTPIVGVFALHQMVMVESGLCLLCLTVWLCVGIMLWQRFSQTAKLSRHNPSARKALVLLTSLLVASAVFSGINPTLPPLAKDNCKYGTNSCRFGCERTFGGGSIFYLNNQIPACRKDPDPQCCDVLCETHIYFSNDHCKNPDDTLWYYRRGCSLLFVQEPPR